MGLGQENRKRAKKFTFACHKGNWPQINTRRKRKKSKEKELPAVWPEVSE